MARPIYPEVTKEQQEEYEKLSGIYQKQRELKSVLDEIEEYLEDRQDADLVGDSHRPNEAMRLLLALRGARKPI